MRSDSFFGRRARHKKMIGRIRSRAPSHPRGPEQQLKLLITRLMTSYHAHLKRQILKVAPKYLIRHGRRQDATDPTLHSVLSDSWNFGRGLLHTAAVKKSLGQAAKATAKSAIQQTKQALNLGDHYHPNLNNQIDDLSSEVFDATDSIMHQSLDRAENVLNEWADLDPDRSERAEDPDALGDMLEEGLSGIMGKALIAVGLAFGNGFADMVRGSQEDAGIGQYMWLSQRDSKVRPFHLELDGFIADWDDPPLKADKSDNEEDDHPGEDFNCRCVASPIAPDEELTERQSERLL